MSLNVFLLLTAYYVLKTAREPLILLAGGAELKSYAAAAQALTLIAAYPGTAGRPRSCRGTASSPR
jgi:AAA family ATP:ADP antiporter